MLSGKDNNITKNIVEELRIPKKQKRIGNPIPIKEESKIFEKIEVINLNTGPTNIGLISVMQNGLFGFRAHCKMKDQKLYKKLMAEFKNSEPANVIINKQKVLDYLASEYQYRIIDTNTNKVIENIPPCFFNIEEKYAGTLDIWSVRLAPNGKVFGSYCESFFDFDTHKGILWDLENKSYTILFKGEGDSRITFLNEKHFAVTRFFKDYIDIYAFSDIKNTTSIMHIQRLSSLSIVNPSSRVTRHEEEDTYDAISAISNDEFVCLTRYGSNLRFYKYDMKEQIYKINQILLGDANTYDQQLFVYPESNLLFVTKTQYKPVEGSFIDAYDIKNKLLQASYFIDSSNFTGNTKLNAIVVIPNQKFVVLFSNFWEGITYTGLLDLKNSQETMITHKYDKIAENICPTELRVMSNGKIIINSDYDGSTFVCTPEMLQSSVEHKMVESKSSLNQSNISSFFKKIKEVKSQRQEYIEQHLLLLDLEKDHKGNFYSDTALWELMQNVLFFDFEPSPQEPLYLKVIETAQLNDSQIAPIKDLNEKQVKQIATCLAESGIRLQDWVIRSVNAEKEKVHEHTNLKKM